MSAHPTHLVARFASFLLLCTAAASGCGGAQSQAAPLDTRPLEEDKALELIDGAAAERGLTIVRNAPVSLSGAQVFGADVRVTGRKIAIEYLTNQDRVEIGAIPPPAQGSKLHVLPGTAVAKAAGQPNDPVFILFLDDRGFEYQYNPTSENRADITLEEVRTRLKRDLVDFFTWYDATQAPSDAPQGPAK
jgi:hypothetical protein